MLMVVLVVLVVVMMMVVVVVVVVMVVTTCVFQARTVMASVVAKLHVIEALGLVDVAQIVIIMGEEVLSLRALIIARAVMSQVVVLASGY
jgi:hypothetical protein